MNKFAFILHPLEARDVARKYPAVHWLPDRAVEWLLRFIPVKVVSHITGLRSITGAEAEGWFIGCPLTARQLKDGDPRKALDTVVACGRLAEELGAGIVGLGAFTAVVADAGITVAERLDIGVTTGNSYTVATALEGAISAAELVGHDLPSCTVTVLGATGSIGRVAAKMMAPRVARVVLNARTQETLEKVAQELAGSGAQIATETDVGAAVKQAEIIIAVTSAVGAVVQPEMLKPGAVVCDVARPRDVARQVAQKRQDVLVIEGGAVSVPGNVEFNFNFGFPPGEAYACMSETMILALEGRFEDYSLGREIQEQQVHEITALAAKHGFKLAGFRSFERKVQEADIARVREKVMAAKSG